MAPLLKVILFFLIPNLVLASELKMGAVVGIGLGSASSTGTYSEGPIGMSVYADYSTTSRVTIGGNHTRTWQTSLVSAISSTTLSIKYYFNGDIPTGFITQHEIVDSSFETRSWAMFAGFEAGFAQSSVKPSSSGNSASAVGIAMGLTGGLDWQILESSGLRLSSTFQTLFMGTGQLSLLVAGGGLYINF